MLIYIALCAVLPLVADAALETCDRTKTTAFLSYHLEESILDTLGGKTFWFVAVGADDSGTYHSVKLSFESANTSSNSVFAEYVRSDSTGAIVGPNTYNTYFVDEDHITNGNASGYLFQCSENLIGSYRCQEDGMTGYTEASQYFIYTEWHNSEADVIEELEPCLDRIIEVDPSATFVRRYHP